MSRAERSLERALEPVARVFVGCVDWCVARPLTTVALMCAAFAALCTGAAAYEVLLPLVFVGLVVGLVGIAWWLS